MARVREMEPADWAEAARLTQAADARGLIALPWETPADLARLAAVAGVTLLVAEDEAGQLAGVGGFRLGRRGEAHLWGPVVATEGHGTGAWLMNRMESMAEAQGASAFVITLALENRAGTAWAEWRGYLRDGEAPTYLLCSGDLPVGAVAGSTATAAYRPAGSADLAELVGLYGALFPADLMDTADWAAVLPEVTVAERAGELAGFLWLRGPTGRIKLMAVAPGARRQGIGRGLVSHAIQSAQSRGLGRVEAKIWQENEAMLALLRQAGFERFLPVSSWVKRPG